MADISFVLWFPCEWECVGVGWTFEGGASIIVEGVVRAAGRANAKPINLYPVRIIDWHCDQDAGHANGHMLGNITNIHAQGTVGQ